MNTNKKNLNKNKHDKCKLLKFIFDINTLNWYLGKIFSVLSHKH